MLKSLRPDDCIVICKLDRLCRSLQDMFNTLEQIKDEGAGLVSLDGAIDTSNSSPYSKLLWKLVSSIAEFETHQATLR